VIKSRKIRWAGHVVHMGKMTNAYKILVGESVWKRLLGRTLCRWEGNIKTDIKVVGCELDLYS
jgi:hypothetical protein